MSEVLRCGEVRVVGGVEGVEGGEGGARGEEEMVQETENGKNKHN